MKIRGVKAPQEWSKKMKKVSYNQSGYNGSSMSKRAVQAYTNGEMPISKWTKQAILARILEILESEDNATLLKFFHFAKMTHKELKTLLVYASWHHTGSFANETEFLKLEESDIIELCSEMPEVTGYICPDITLYDGSELRSKSLWYQIDELLTKKMITPAFIKAIFK